MEVTQRDGIADDTLAFFEWLSRMRKDQAKRRVPYLVSSRDAVNIGRV
jgi:hypothetical protein